MGRDEIKDKKKNPTDCNYCTKYIVALAILLEIDPNFLADPLRSRPCPILVVITLGVRDVIWQSVGEAVPYVLGAIITICRIFLFVLGFVPSHTSAAEVPAG